jgi:hypothetical protein
MAVVGSPNNSPGPIEHPSATKKRSKERSSIFLLGEEKTTFSGRADTKCQLEYISFGFYFS